MPAGNTLLQALRWHWTGLPPDVVIDTKRRVCVESGVDILQEREGRENPELGRWLLNWESCVGSG